MNRLLQEARRLLRQVEAKPLDVHVPALLLCEVRNMLLLKLTSMRAAWIKPLMIWKPCRSSRCSARDASLKRAARVGKQFNLTFYDASFLALAVELDCPPITRRWSFFSNAPVLFHASGIFQSWQSVDPTNNELFRFLLIFFESSAEGVVIEHSTRVYKAIRPPASKGCSIREQPLNR